MSDFRNIVLKLIKGGSCVIPNVFYDDTEIVFAAVEKNGRAYLDASSRLQKNKELVLLAIKTFSYIYFNIPEELQYDPDIIVEAVQHSRGCLWGSIPKSLRTNTEIVYRILSSKMPIDYFGPDVFTNIDFIRVAITNPNLKLECLAQCRVVSNLGIVPQAVEDVLFLLICIPKF